MKSKKSIIFLKFCYYSGIDIKPTSDSGEMLSPDLRETFVLSEVLSNLADYVSVRARERLVGISTRIEV